MARWQTPKWHSMTCDGSFKFSIGADGGSRKSPACENLNSHHGGRTETTETERDVNNCSCQRLLIADQQWQCASLWSRNKHYEDTRQESPTDVRRQSNAEGEKKKKFGWRSLSQKVRIKNGKDQTRGAQFGDLTSSAVATMIIDQFAVPPCFLLPRGMKSIYAMIAEDSLDRPACDDDVARRGAEVVYHLRSNLT